MSDVVDITILGAGPAGLAAAYYAGHRDASVRMIESLEQLGGQVAAVYPEKHVYDVAGHPKIQGTALVELCAEQGLQYGPEVHLGEEVQTLERLAQNGEELLAIGTDQGGPYLTRALIITAGHGAFEPRKLGIEGIEDWEGKGVHYFVREKDVFRDRTCVIVGRRRLGARLDARAAGHGQGADRARPPARQLPRARVLGQRGARARGRRPRAVLHVLRGARAARRRLAAVGLDREHEDRRGRAGRRARR